MIDATYNHQTITRYLLGTLPVPETERLDELSLTSEEFAEALSAGEKDLVDAYVHGELSGEALKQFQSHYLVSPLRRKRVEFARAFQEFGAKTVAELVVPSEEGLTNSEAGHKGAGRPAGLNIFAAPRFAFQWFFLIATLVLVVVGGFLVFQNVRLRQRNSRIEAVRDELQEREQRLQKEVDNQRTANAQAAQELSQVREERARLEAELKPSSNHGSEAVIASLTLSPQLRDGEAIKTVRISSERGLVSGVLQLEPNDYSTYNVALIDESNDRILWQSGRAKAREAAGQQTLNVRFRADLLKPRAYLLKVYGFSSSGAAEPMSNYLFKVVQ